MNVNTNLSDTNSEIVTPASSLGWQIEKPEEMLSEGALELYRQEQGVAVDVQTDLSLRAKVIDACGLTCTFCHNEGTPVAVDNQKGITVVGKTGRSGRISVFSAINGVDFLPGRMEPDKLFANSLSQLRSRMGYEELHLTGGEPSLHPRLLEIIRVANETGYSVRMTSNGERGANIAETGKEGGLEKVNFSIFGTTPEELAAVQDTKYQDIRLAAKKIDALHEAITTCADAGIEVSANVVLSDQSHMERVRRLLDAFDSRLDIRVLPDLSRGMESVAAIYEFLGSLGAVPVLKTVEAGSSNARVKYLLPEKRTIHFKQIRPTRIPECGSCQFNNQDDCREGYYGTRLYIDKAGKYLVGVCIQRMDLVETVDEFTNGPLSEQILRLRDQEYAELRAGQRTV